MRFILNKFPDDENFQPDEDWTPLKESANLWIVQLQAIPFMIVNVTLMVLFMRLIGVNFELNTMIMLISFLIFMPIHEFIHALFFPEKLWSKNVFFGFTFKGFAPFAAYIGEMKRNTFIKVLLAPFIIITLLGFLYLIIFGRNELIEHIIVFNALGSCADCLCVFLILRQVPQYAKVRNKKIRTYWKNK
ncbi:MAG: DUF3267 domain-containing protein [Calditrichaceae bacterium]|nr:DUF3267 domain-containing protein [Calditrichaceae bacterium]MBN2709842.1 DUF3267 domain-containing protein [Calditrichaceae bacterium]RQV95396.1 MAG: DUF3267 domain-containing protein [Calditrichota bacterium]